MFDTNNIVNFSFSLSLSLMFNPKREKERNQSSIEYTDQKKFRHAMIVARKSSILLVRRNETICCLIGFGIGVGCCILYRIISNLLNPAASIAVNKRDVSIFLVCQDHFLFISRRKSPREKH